MKYIDLLVALDVLARYYPKYSSTEVIQLAEDIFKWFNNELPEDSSTLVYLRSYFSSPTDAMKSIWKELQLMAGPFLYLN